jgi:deoxyribonucleoside regulator
MHKTANYEQLSKDSFLERIARMYYVLELSQQEISERLSVGRSSVARFLQEAKEKGIIQFHIHSSLDNCRLSTLEKRLTRKYGLKDCAVFCSNDSSYSFEYLAAQYLNSVLPTQGAIGLGWGRTLYTVGTQLNLADPRPGLKIVQLTGGSGAKEELVPAASVIQLWSQALRGKPLLFPAPAIALNEESRDGFLAEPSIQELMTEIRNISAAIVGVGDSGENATIITSGLVPGLTGSILSEKSVGDVIFHFYDKTGRFSFQELSKRVVGASAEDFMSIGLRIGIAYGRHKREAILGALQGGLLHVLLTTEQTAAVLLNE